MTPEQARKVDPTLADLTDSQLERVLEILENLAEIALGSWARNNPGVSKVRGGYLEEEEEVR